MLRQTRVNYDEIAHLYDAQSYRVRAVDPELLALAGRPIRRGSGVWSATLPMRACQSPAKIICA